MSDDRVGARPTRAVSRGTSPRIRPRAGSSTSRNAAAATTKVAATTASPARWARPGVRTERVDLPQGQPVHLQHRDVHQVQAVGDAPAVHGPRPRPAPAPGPRSATASAPTSSGNSTITAPPRPGPKSSPSQQPGRDQHRQHRGQHGRAAPHRGRGSRPVRAEPAHRQVGQHPAAEATEDAHQPAPRVVRAPGAQVRPGHRSQQGHRGRAASTAAGSRRSRKKPSAATGNSR